MLKARCRPGEVRDAIFEFMQECERPASVEDIASAVKSRLQENVAASSVRSYLRLNTDSAFTRVARGRYELKRESQELPFEGKRQFDPVIRCGNSSVFHADCFEWLDRQPSESIHAIVTDPPYGLVEYSQEQQQKLRSGRGGVWRIPPSFDGHQRSPLPRFTTLTQSDLQNLEAFFTRWARSIRRVLVPGAHVVVASNPLLSYLVAHTVVKAGFERRGEIIRLVMTMRGGDRPKNAHLEFPDVSVMCRSMWEPWLVFRKPLEGRVQDNLRKWKTGGLRRPSAARPFGDVIVSHPTRPAERALAPHPSLKPQAFLRQVVRAVLPLGEGVVLDTFAGSGSTLAAAEAVGYQSIGVEKDDSYVAMAAKAIQPLSALALKR